MNCQATYKRVKINWWIIIIMVAPYVPIISAYVYHWDNSPVIQPLSLIFHAIMIVTLLLLGRFKVIINDNYAVFRSDVWVPVKIPISMIENVSVKQVPLMEMYIPGGNTVKYQFDFVTQAVSIMLKSGKIYQIAIKDAERIKEEIEKQMIKANNYSQFHENQ